MAALISMGIVGEGASENVKGVTLIGLEERNRRKKKKKKKIMRNEKQFTFQSAFQLIVVKPKPKQLL